MQEQIREINYEGQQIFCGIDVHKKQWKMTVCTAHTIQRAVTFERPFVKNVKNYLERKYRGGQYIVAYEAGFSGFWAQKSFQEVGIDAIVVNPADIPTTDKEKKQKNDKRDSKKIAESLRSGQLLGLYVPSDIALKDRSTIRERWSIANSERRVKNQIKGHLMFFGIDIPEGLESRYWSRRFIKWLEKVRDERDDKSLGLKLERLLQLRDLQLQATKELRVLAATPRHINTYHVLRSVPGVGLLISMILIGEIMDIKRFGSFDKLSSYVGFIPTSKSSGEKELLGEMTNRKNNRILSMLVQAAWTAIKCDRELLMKYENYRKRMNSQKAIIRIARILLRRIQCIWLKGIKYKKAEV